MKLSIVLLPLILWAGDIYSQAQTIARKDTAIVKFPIADPSNPELQSPINVFAYRFYDKTAASSLNSFPYLLLPKGDYLIVVKESNEVKKFYLDQNYDLRIRSGDTLRYHNIRLEPKRETFNLHVELIDHNTFAPIPFATVELAERIDSTNDNGTINFNELPFPNQRYPLIEVTHELYSPKFEKYKYYGDGINDTLRIELAKSHFPHKINIETTLGEPIEGLTLSLKGSTIDSYTYEEGAYSFENVREGYQELTISGLDPGKYKLGDNELKEVIRFIDARKANAASTIEIPLLVLPRIEIKGKVHDDSGKELEGASVILRTDYGTKLAMLTTDKNGFFKTKIKQEKFGKDFKFSVEARHNDFKDIPPSILNISHKEFLDSTKNITGLEFDSVQRQFKNYDLEIKKSVDNIDSIIVYAHQAFGIKDSLERNPAIYRAGEKKKETQITFRAPLEFKTAWIHVWEKDRDKPRCAKIKRDKFNWPRAWKVKKTCKHMK